MADSNSVTTRKIAAIAVSGVLGPNIALEDAIAQQPEYASLDPRDRAFARAIAATTLRRLGQIDAALKPLLRSPPPRDVHAVLRTATAQMVFMDTPPHAAVGDSVAATHSMGQPKFAKLVNAVLRRVSEDGPKSPKVRAMTAPPKTNLPGWLRGSWEAAYGAQAMRRIALQFQKSPPLDLSVKSDPELWAEKLGGELLPTGTVRLEKIGNITELEGFDDGAWWAQDIAASLPALMLDIEPGMRVLDLCAAPGGKTLQLAARGAKVTSLDINETRLTRLRENLARTKLDADIVVADALEWSPDAPFDAVLLDAPCSATGTLRRHPDVLHNKTPKAVSQLTGLQRRLLARACDFVAPGGQLVYATCSLQPEEGRPQIDKLLSKRSDFGLNPTLTTMVSKLSTGLQPQLFEDGYLRSLPYFLGDKGGMDGFFAARVDRMAG